jgi:hypothetical protein
MVSSLIMCFCFTRFAKQSMRQPISRSFCSSIFAKYNVGNNKFGMHLYQYIACQAFCVEAVETIYDSNLLFHNYADIQSQGFAVGKCFNSCNI